MREGKEEERKKEEEQIEIFTFDFLDFEKDSWNSGSIFYVYIRIAKGFQR